MKNYIRFFVLSILIISNVTLFSQDTSYNAIATPKILRIIKPGKAPFLTIQFSASYNNGLMDLAANDNTAFHTSDFVNGKNFGTRHGFGFILTGKIALHQEGNIRLNISAMYNRLQSNFLISASPEGKVGYNVMSGGLGLEDNFTPDRPFKPYIGFDIIPSLISGTAVWKTNTTDSNLTIKSSFRIGLSVNFGFEYALTNNAGINVGLRLTHANLFFKDAKNSTKPNETYLNDAQYSASIPYSGWKQFFYGSMYIGFNYYFGMKNKK